jgi:hypothetical protein
MLARIEDHLDLVLEESFRQIMGILGMTLFKTGMCWMMGIWLGCRLSVRHPRVWECMEVELEEVSRGVMTTTTKMRGTTTTTPGMTTMIRRWRKRRTSHDNPAENDGQMSTTTSIPNKQFQQIIQLPRHPSNQPPRRYYSRQLPLFNKLRRNVTSELSECVSSSISRRTGFEKIAQRRRLSIYVFLSATQISRPRKRNNARLSYEEESNCRSKNLNWIASRWNVVQEWIQNF